MDDDRGIVTGASGFVGRALRARLGDRTEVLSLRGDDWPRAAGSIEFAGATVYHLAARVHETGAPESEYQRDNVTKTRELGRLAACGGAKRFVFLSTLKVHGDESGARPIGPMDPPAPRDAYARSKLAAEEALREVATGTGMSLRVVRAPLVYGRGARGNLAALLRLADSGWPLPFASIENRRSFVHRDDLVEMLLACGRDPAGGTSSHLAVHRQPACTRDLFLGLRRALRRPARLVSCPRAALELGASMAGQADRIRRLTRSLEADASFAERELGWVARKGLEVALADLVEGYRAPA